jgi:RNA-binding protein
MLPMAATLTPARRSELRAQAHTLRPVVLIGDKGLTDEVVAEIGRALSRAAGAVRGCLARA